MENHNRDISQLLQRLKGLLQTAAGKGFTYEIDLAVDREELEGRTVFGLYFDTDLMKQLSELGIDLRVTIYVCDYSV